MKIKKLIKVGSVLLLSATLLAACGDGSSKAKSSGGSSEKSTIKTITWMSMLHTATPPSGDVQSKLEKYTGKKIKFNWVPDASKDERINAALASKSLADIVSLTDMTNTTVRKALESGMFWDVEPYLKDYPNLAKISKETLDSSKLDGHVYGVPYQKPLARYGILVRQDWLDNLGLKTPKTLDDLEKVAEAFTEDDPDGNGKKDTVGFVERNESFNVGFRSLTGYFGAGNLFAVEDGKVIPSFMQSGYTKALKWYRNIYKNGWMNSDFSVMAKNDQKNYIAQGKGGIVVSGLMEASNYIAAAKGTDQEKTMKWALINDMTEGNVDRRILSDTGGGFGGYLAIPKQEVKTKADLKVVLKFINDLMDKKPYVLMTEGIEGVHYSKNDKDQYEITDQTKWQQEVQPYASSRPSELVMNLKYTDPLRNLQDKKIAENAKYAVINPAQSLTSATYDTQYSSLIEGVSDAYYKYMMGEINMDGWNTAVKKFRADGGDQIIKEYTASYKKLNK
ncbi:extracellular solute-binding protein [Lapidilactobacillus mulanensis]|uniref:Extracellular solute-binding protein n=1 Tax=Lapidilactobacillus mulanensis TaxID=2485999 RepID=A0ABW4DRN2_9LACO|nr:extracellular solute-binding protein [Lapidilactobacillus mulanensis]